MMKLYGRHTALNVQKVIWCLAELRLSEPEDYVRVDAGLQYGVVDTAAYRALNPNGRVPTLVDGEFILWESNSIVRYLAAKCGDETLLPQGVEARANVERWMDWQATTLCPDVDIAYQRLTRVEPAHWDLATVRAAYSRATTRLAMLDAVLRECDYVAGRAFTVADIVTGLTARRWFALSQRFAGELRTEQPLSRVADWLARLAARDAFLCVEQQMPAL